jgi:hypothetical protein
MKLEIPVYKEVEDHVIKKVLKPNTTHEYKANKLKDTRIID